jgi:hypothetical protein
MANIFSVKPHKSSKSPSESQTNHRAGFGLMMSQVSLFSGAIAIGFRDNKDKLAPGNAALKYNLKNALTGTAPNHSINYAEFLISRGKLHPVSTPAVVAVAGETATLDFSWIDGGFGVTQPTDLIKVYIHTPGIESLVTNGAAVTRTALKLRMVIPFEFIGLPLHCYIMVVSADGKKVSNSLYCGSVTLT